jgi:hypothetical protein
MKRIVTFGILILFACFGLVGCYKDVIYPEQAVDPEGPPQFVSYKAELAPLFNTSCAKSGCHLSPAHKPYLSTDISYTQLVNGGFVNTTIPKESKLYIMINGEMKEFIPSAADRQKVYDWIRNGAPNN